MIFAILTAILAYRKAKETGRSPWLWAIVGAAVFIGTQLVIGLGIGIFLGFGVALLDWSESIFDTAELPITIVSVILAFVASWGLLKFLDRRPVAEFGHSAPPPPPAFGQLNDEPRDVTSPGESLDNTEAYKLDSKFMPL